MPCVFCPSLSPSKKHKLLFPVLIHSLHPGTCPLANLELGFPTCSWLPWFLASVSNPRPPDCPLGWILIDTTFSALSSNFPPKLPVRLINGITLFRLICSSGWHGSFLAQDLMVNTLSWLTLLCVWDWGTWWLLRVSDHSGSWFSVSVHPKVLGDFDVQCEWTSPSLHHPSP